LEASIGGICRKKFQKKWNICRKFVFLGVKKKKEYLESKDDSILIASDSMAYYQSYSFNPVVLTFSKEKSNSGQLVPKGSSSLISLIKKGITRKSLDDLILATGLSLSEMANYMHVSERTLRNYASTVHLAPDPSERAIEIALLYEKGKETFGTLESFKKYMSSEVLGLGSKKPKEFLDTSVGINLLMEELGKIQYGIFA